MAALRSITHMQRRARPLKVSQFDRSVGRQESSVPAAPNPVAICRATQINAASESSAQPCTALVQHTNFPGHHYKY